MQGPRRIYLFDIGSIVRYPLCVTLMAVPNYLLHHLSGMWAAISHLYF